MKTELEKAPWYDGEPTRALRAALEIIADGVWREAASDFYAERVAKEALGKKAPKGIQPFLNDVLDRRFGEEGWIANQGRFTHQRTWVRVTFRHQMSLGSDLIDALRLAKKEDFEQVAVLAADRDFLDIITPNDAGALVSFDKLRVEVQSLEGCLDIPLMIGRLRPQSQLPPDVARVVSRGRPRDTYAPRS